MKRDYLCPHCKGKLNVENKVIFSTKTKKDFGLICLSADLGNYEFVNHPSYKIENDEHVQFFCPICHKKLQAQNVNDNLAMIIMFENEQTNYVYFSKIAGEKCTYVIKDSKITGYGEDAYKYLNLFNLASMK